MTMLVLGLLLFLGVHSTRIVADRWRGATIARVGEMPWKGIYSVVSLVGFVLLVWGYALARHQPVVLWSPPPWTRHVTALLMLPVFVMFVASYVPRNGIRAKLRHPQVLSVKVWALAHLLSNGMLADVLLFGGFLLWSIFDFRAARERDRVALAAARDPSSAPTGFTPMETPSPISGSATATTVVVGLVIYGAFVMGLHTWLIGVRPF